HAVYDRSDILGFVIVVQSLVFLTVIVIGVPVHVVKIAGTPYYVEADMVIECKIMYAAPFDPKNFKSDVPKNMYANFPAGIHTMYIGEVVNAWKK
ncbi:MAG: hypothetical protein IIT40_10995, partial [Prevotella sp.]|nr:hypothetical protein [Prevotella sp.]